MAPTDEEGAGEVDKNGLSQGEATGDKESEEEMNCKDCETEGEEGKVAVGVSG